MVPPKITSLKLALAVAATALITQSGPTHAALCTGMTGDTVTVTQTGFFPMENVMETQVEVVCGANTPEIVGQDIPGGFGNMVGGEFIDIDAESISGNWVPVAFFDPQTFVLSDFDWLGEPGVIVGISDFFSEDMTFTESAISTTADTITIDVSGLAAGGAWSFNIDVRHDVDVPEPPALALFGLALAGLCAVRRRKSARA